jgi:hypothetical protein
MIHRNWEKVADQQFKRMDDASQKAWGDLRRRVSRRS